MKRKIKIIAIIGLGAFLLWVGQSTIKSARAEPISVTVASLKTLYLAVGAATTLGIINSTQRDSFQRSIDQMLDQLASATQRTLEGIWREAQNLAQQIRQWISAPVSEQCTWCPMEMHANESRALEQSNVQNDTITHSRSLNCIHSPECCKGKEGQRLFGDKFRRLFNNQTKVQGSHGMAYRIFKDKKHRKIQCCLEWDTQHGSWEVYTKNGRHLGERSCSDLNDDPCAVSTAIGSHAQADTSSGHASRFCQR